MKKSEMRRWMTAWLKTQKKITVASFAGLCALGAAATLAEFVVVLLILHIGFISSWALDALVAIGILAAVQAGTWLNLNRQLPDRVLSVELPNRDVKVRIPATIADAWTYAFGSMDSNQSRIELLLGVLTMPQRMCCAAYFVWQRLQQLKQVQVETCSDVIMLLHERGERVDAKDLASELELSDVPGTIRDVTLIDGVVPLTRGTLGLSLASRLVDDLAAWGKKPSRDQSQSSF